MGLYNMLRPLETEQQYQDALAEAFKLMQKELKPGSSEYIELEVLSIVIEQYENEHYSISPPSIELPSWRKPAEPSA